MSYLSHRNYAAVDDLHALPLEQFLLEVDELRPKPLVGADIRFDSANVLEGHLEGHAAALHHVGDADGGGASAARETVDENTFAALDGGIDELDGLPNH